MDGGDAATLLDDKAKISPKPKRRASAPRRAPAPASNVMYLPAARKPRAKASAPPVAPVPMPPPVEVPELANFEPVPEALPPVKPAAPVVAAKPSNLDPFANPAPLHRVQPASPVPPGNLDDDYPFDDIPFDALPKAPLKGPSPRKRDAAGRFVSANGTPSRKRPQRQAAPVFQPSAQTILPPALEAAPLPQARPSFWRRVNWWEVGCNALTGFLCCSIAAAFCFFAAMAIYFAHSMIFGLYYYESEPFWHWLVSCIAGLLALPFLIAGAALRGGQEIANAMNTPNHPMGALFGGDTSPNQQTSNGNSQFALYSGVQQSGIWQP